MPGFAGFDRSDYPGDHVRNWLKPMPISHGAVITWALSKSSRHNVDGPARRSLARAGGLRQFT